MSRLRALFGSFDSDGNGTVDREEMEAYLVGIGVRSRRARSVVKSAIVRVCGGTLDWESFVGISHFLVPPGIADGDGQLDPERVDTVFDRIAGPGRATASVDDVERYTRSTMPFFLRPFVGTLARAAANGVVGTLSREEEECVRREDLRDVVTEIVQEKARLNESKRR